MADDISPRGDLSGFAAVSAPNLAQMTHFEALCRAAQNNHILCLGEEHGEARNNYDERQAVLAIRRMHPNARIAVFMELPPEGLQPAVDANRAADVPELYRHTMLPLMRTCRENNAQLHCVDMPEKPEAFPEREQTDEERGRARDLRNRHMSDRIARIMREQNIDYAITINGTPHFSNPTDSRAPTDMDEMIETATGKKVMVIEMRGQKDGKVPVVLRPQQYVDLPTQQKRDRPDMFLNTGRFGALEEAHFRATSDLEAAAYAAQRAARVSTKPEEAAAFRRLSADLYDFTGHQSLAPNAANSEQLARSLNDQVRGLQGAIAGSPQRDALTALDQKIQKFQELDTQLAAQQLATTLPLAEVPCSPGISGGPLQPCPPIMTAPARPRIFRRHR